MLTSEQSMHVAFFCDHAMLPGLHGALASLLAHLDRGDSSVLRLHLFIEGACGAEADLLRRTHDAAAWATELRIHEFSPSVPQGGRTLLGSGMVYGRWQLPELLPEAGRCLYLDSDVLVLRDVRRIFRDFDGRAALLASGLRVRRDALDARFYEAVGLPMDGFGFNSGVLGMDLDLWRERGITERCFALARRRARESRLCDQGLLNAVLGDDFKAIEPSWNHLLEPWTESGPGLDGCICHFLRCPKPWDVPFGWCSSHRELWLAWFRRTALAGQPLVRYASARRMLRMVRPAARTVMKRAKRAFRRTGRPAEAEGK